MRRQRAFASTVAVLAAVFLLSGTPTVAADVEDVEDHWIVVTDGQSRSLLAFDPEATDWNSASAIRWSWKPSAARGYSTAEVAAWGGGTDARLRTTPRFGPAFVAADGSGLVTVASYPEGRRLWATVQAGNVHSAELLPDGRVVAVAASSANWVRAYATEPGIEPAQFDLISAHATWWDPEIQRLWVIGQDPGTKAHILTALVVGRADRSLTLTEDPRWRATLPTAWGHDVSPDLAVGGRLLVTTNGGAYVFDKSSTTFTSAPNGADRTFVKGITSRPSGWIVETKSDASKEPPGGCVQYNTWCTESVDLYSSGGEPVTRTRTDAAFYKVRTWTDRYL